MKGKVTALVGAQYGSEGKGNIAKALAWDYEVHVRTGGPNAGHTIWHDGEIWKMRSVPCGWVNQEAKLVIGAGAVIDPQELVKECRQLEEFGYHIFNRLFIDRNASIILPAHRHFEGGVEGVAHQRIGSTGEGVGPCRMAKIARTTVDSMPFDQFFQAKDLLTDPFKLCNASRMLRDARLAGQSILLEGTQGMGLSLTHGDWPYVTSADTSAAQLAADAGIPPQSVTDVILVARTFPIRVAGNSGTLRKEVTWNEVGVDAERTTVTNKVRRVGLWDMALLSQAVVLNGPTAIALTFCDYLREHEAWDLAAKIEKEFDVPVSYMAWGPDEVEVVEKVAA